MTAQHTFQRVEYLGSVAQRFCKTRRPDRQNHEFLDIDVVVSMRATVDDVHHWHRHRGAIPKVAEKRNALGSRSRFGYSERDSEYRVCPENPFCLGPIQFEHALV